MNKILLLLLVTFVVLASSAQSADLDDAIQRHRKGAFLVRTEPGAKVTVEQQRHEFWFGAAISSKVFHPAAPPAEVAKYKRMFLQNFNAAVTENALKWKQMEPRHHRIDYQYVDGMLAWADEHELPIRGHCIYWGIPNRVQDWVKQMDDAELESTLKRRGIEIGKKYGSRFAELDLNNEMLHANYYERRLGADITGKMAGWVKQGNPDSVLYVNDYDILTGNLVDRYVEQIQGFLDAGVPIGGIGVQGHLHAESFDSRALQDSLDKLAVFGLPIRVTEFNVPGQRSRFFKDRSLTLTPEQEQTKADALVEYYRICFAHPAVHGILMWGFWEEANWIPASSMYKRDWTPTPAAVAYRELVFNDWWTSWTGQADERGRCRVPAFFGRHEVTSLGQSQTVELKKEAKAKEVFFSK